MKRFLSILLVAVLMISSMSLAVFAAGGSATADITDKTVHAGDTVDLTVTVSGEFANYELTLSADSGLTIKKISGVTANIKNGKVAFSTYENVKSHSFTVTVEVGKDVKPGTYNVYANMTLATMVVDEAEDNDGIKDNLVHVSKKNGTGVLTVVCEHDWSAWSQTKAPTCKEFGEETRTCANCGEKETRQVAKTSHNWGEWTEIKAPTCKEAGVEERICSICGDKETREIAKTSHNWGEWTQTKAPTCKEAGVEERVCSICGEKETREIAKTAHNWGDWMIVTEATCTTDGLKSRECSICHEKETQVITATGHNWSEWTETKAPTCTEKGEETRTCSVCGEKETRAIDALGHKFNHNEWEYNETNHWHECSVCGAKCEHNAEHGPVTEWQIIKQPTANESGLKQKFCETCGAVVASEEIAPNGQGTLDPVPPTGDPTGMLMAGGLSVLLLVLLAVALYLNKRRASAK